MRSFFNMTVFFFQKSRNYFKYSRYLEAILYRRPKMRSIQGLIYQNDNPGKNKQNDIFYIQILNLLDKKRAISSIRRLDCKEKYLLLQPGKSYTACSLGTPPGLDRSKGTWL